LGFLLQQDNCKIHTLDLADNAFTEDGIEEFSHGLKKTQSLRVLNMSDNTLGEDGMAALSRGLVDNTSIKTLGLGNCNLGDKEAKLMARILSFNETIEELFIHCNQISDAGVQDVNEVLKEENSTLSVLYDEENKIADKSLSLETEKSLIRNQKKREKAEALKAQQQLYKSKEWKGTNFPKPQTPKPKKSSTLKKTPTKNIPTNTTTKPQNISSKHVTSTSKPITTNTNSHQPVTATTNQSAESKTLKPNITNNPHEDDDVYSMHFHDDDSDDDVTVDDDGDDDQLLDMIEKQVEENVLETVMKKMDKIEQVLGSNNPDEEEMKNLGFSVQPQEEKQGLDAKENTQDKDGNNGDEDECDDGKTYVWTGFTSKDGDTLTGNYAQKI